jgi:flagellar protein FliO/FliZ
VQTEPLAAVAAPVIRPLVASAHFEETARPTRVEPMLGEAETAERNFEPPAPAVSEPMPSAATEEAEAVIADAPALVDEPPPPQAGAEENLPETPDISSEPAPAIAMDDAGPEAAETPAEERDRAAKVSDLEREMARLLGEITSRRES